MNVLRESCSVAERVKERVEEVKNSEACVALCGEGGLTRLGQGRNVIRETFQGRGRLGGLRRARD